ncbi:MAG: hypothetical protein SGJ21_07980, partial [Alphaproteobacteria bacterium]|nr:hypothetical protein [Alphaproteobacteria bacterium]
HRPWVMRVEPAPHVFRCSDRRQRQTVLASLVDRRSPSPDRRARHERQPWLSAVFGVHLLGQPARTGVSPRLAARAYAQPESRTPLRPRYVRTA